MPLEPLSTSASAHAPGRGGSVLPEACDLLVAGSGAGGLGAAVVAAHLGLQVVVVEQAAQFGGTTAWSGGWMWVPRNPLAVAAGIVEDLDPVRAYLREVLGAGVMDHPRHAQAIEMYLAHAPQAVAFHQRHSALRFIDGNAMPDFHGGAAGAREGGRSVCAAPFDARVLGADLKRLVPPRDVLSFMGMGLGGGADLRHFLRATRSLESASYVARRLLRHARDVLAHGRGTWLMGGNAMAGALLHSALQGGVTCLERHALVALQREGRRVTAARVNTPQGTRTVQVRRGVVLACGGFAHDAARRSSLFAHAPTGHEHHSAAWLGNMGDGLRVAEAAGVPVDAAMPDAAAWAPVSLVPLPSGESAAFAHLVERGKPGLLAVDAQGQRFANEAANYHSFMRAMLGRGLGAAWLVCDHRFQRRYGLGHSKPWPVPLGPALASGYLRRAATLAGLAQQCGIDATGLQATVARYNRDAELGTDTAFQRGGTAYERLAGDAEWPGPNPCMAPLYRPPFYAVRIVPGSLGTFAGVAADEHGRALDTEGQPIEGLYVNGNDRASIWRGHYPSGGITLGPALTFGYLLAHHAAGLTPPPGAATP